MYVAVNPLVTRAGQAEIGSGDAAATRFSGKAPVEELGEAGCAAGSGGGGTGGGGELGVLQHLADGLVRNRR